MIDFQIVSRIRRLAGWCVCVAASTAMAMAAPLKVTATVTMVADLVRQVGGEDVEVQALMGPGVDPHLYKASATDVVKLQEATVIFYSGLMLEGKMEDLFKRMKSAQRRVYAVTENLPKERLLHPASFSGHPDPHVWFDVALWSECVPVVVARLAEADPARKAAYERRGEEVRRRLAALHTWAKEKAEELPAARRILVTSHDAFNYFGRAYGFQVVGLQGISTVTEAGLADMSKMAEFIRTRKIRAVFAESSVPRQAIDRISADTGARVGGEIFSDAMGTPGQMENGYDLGTYEGMIKHNLNTIVSALK